MASNTIKLNHELIPAVLSGTKKATTRLGIKNIKLGFAVLLDNATGETYPIDVTEVRTLQFKDINLELAKIENYPSIEDFKAALVKIYGDITGTADLTVIYFDLV